MDCTHVHKTKVTRPRRYIFKTETFDFSKLSRPRRSRLRLHPCMDLCSCCPSSVCTVVGLETDHVASIKLLEQSDLIYGHLCAGRQRQFTGVQHWRRSRLVVSSWTGQLVTHKLCRHRLCTCDQQRDVDTTDHAYDTVKPINLAAVYFGAYFY